MPSEKSQTLKVIYDSAYMKLPIIEKSIEIECILMADKVWGESKGEKLLNGEEALLWSDENALELNRDGHCTTL
jgi:hypothetical protein